MVQFIFYKFVVKFYNLKFNNQQILYKNTFYGYFYFIFVFTYWYVYQFYVTSEFTQSEKKYESDINTWKIFGCVRMNNFSFQLSIFSRVLVICLHISVTPIFALCILVIFANYVSIFHRIFTLFSLIMK